MAYLRGCTFPHPQITLEVGTSMSLLERACLLDCMPKPLTALPYQQISSPIWVCRSYGESICACPSWSMSSIKHLYYLRHEFFARLKYSLGRVLITMVLNKMPMLPLLRTKNIKKVSTSKITPTTNVPTSVLHYYLCCAQKRGKIKKL